MKKISCQEVLDQLWEYLDEEARAELCSEINEHLERCHDCQVEVDSLRMTVRIFRCEDHTPVPVLLSDKLRAAMSAIDKDPDPDAR